MSQFIGTTVAVGQLIVAAAIASFAWRQWRIAQDKLRLDLFDKRFAVWSSLLALFVEIWRDRALQLASISAYSAGTASAAFLFDSDVQQYLDRVRDQAIKLQSQGRRIRIACDQGKVFGMSERERQDYNARVESEAGLIEWFLHEAEKTSNEMFRPYFEFNTAGIRRKRMSRCRFAEPDSGRATRQVSDCL